jgi:hypothetical protein
MGGTLHGRRQRWLSTASRSCGGAPARRRAREEERQRKCECVKAGVSSRDVQGRASSRGGGTASKGCCWQASGTRGGSGGGGVMWRSEERPAEAGKW